MSDDILRFNTPEAARVRLVHDLTGRINRSPVALFTSQELKTKTKLTDGQWLDRTTAFVEDARNGFSNAGLVRDVVRGLLTKRFAEHLAPLTVAKYATLIRDAVPPKKYKGTGSSRPTT